MRCDVLTLFPAVVEAYAAVGVLGKAAASGILDLRAHDLRRWAINRYGQVDDEPYGGGPGMVLMASVVVPAVRDVLSSGGEPGRVVITTPRGRRFDDAVAREVRTFLEGLIRSGVVTAVRSDHILNLIGVPFLMLALAVVLVRRRMASAPSAA